MAHFPSNLISTSLLALPIFIFATLIVSAPPSPLTPPLSLCTVSSPPVSIIVTLFYLVFPRNPSTNSNWSRTQLHVSLPKPPLPTTSLLSYSNCTGFQFISVSISKSSSIPLKPFTTSPLPICLNYFTPPPPPAPSDPPPPSTSRSPLPGSPPWGAELSAALLPNFGTHSHLTSATLTPSLCLNPLSKLTYSGQHSIYSSHISVVFSVF